MVNGEATIIGRDASCDQEHTIIGDIAPSESSNVTSQGANCGCEGVAVVASAPKSVDANVHEHRGGSGRIVAGAVGGVLLGSAAAFHAVERAHAANFIIGDDSHKTVAKGVAVAQDAASESMPESAAATEIAEEVQMASIEEAHEEAHEEAAMQHGDVDTDALGGDSSIDAEDSADAVHFAEGVNDNMSFNQAFAAARAEVGAGGAFEWRGQIYGTYYGDEWEAMSDEQKDAFGAKFDFGGADSSYEAEVTSNAADTDVEIVIDEDADDDFGDEVEILGIVDDDEDIDISFATDDEVVLIDIVEDEDCDDLMDVDDSSMALVDDFDNDVDVDDNLLM